MLMGSVWQLFETSIKKQDGWGIEDELQQSCILFLRKGMNCLSKQHLVLDYKQLSYRVKVDRFYLQIFNRTASFFSRPSPFNPESKQFYFLALILLLMQFYFNFEC